MKIKEMKIKEKLCGTFIALALLGTSFTTQAASIWLTTSGADISVSDTVALDVWSNFSDQATQAGGFDIVYDDSILNFVSFVFDSAFQPAVTDPFFSRTCDDLPGVCSSIGIGNFNGIGGSGTSDYLMGQITFDTISDGTALLSITDGSNPAGPFINFNDGSIMVLDYVGASVTVSPSAVPLPAAAWLMLSGLGAVFGFCKRKSNVASV